MGGTATVEANLHNEHLKKDKSDEGISEKKTNPRNGNLHRDTSYKQVPNLQYGHLNMTNLEKVSVHEKHICKR